MNPSMVSDKLLFEKKRKTCRRLSRICFVWMLLALLVLQVMTFFVSYHAQSDFTKALLYALVPVAGAFVRGLQLALQGMGSALILFILLVAWIVLLSGSVGFHASVRHLEEEEQQSARPRHSAPPAVPLTDNLRPASPQRLSQTERSNSRMTPSSSPVRPVASPAAAKPAVTNAYMPVTQTATVKPSFANPAVHAAAAKPTAPTTYSSAAQSPAAVHATAPAAYRSAATQSTNASKPAAVEACGTAAQPVQTATPSVAASTARTTSGQSVQYRQMLQDVQAFLDKNKL